MDRVAIVIPTYEEGELLRSTLCSIINNCSTIPHDVYVVVDSVYDSSVNIVKNMSEQYKNINLLVQNSKGAYKAIKYGVETTTAPFLIICTADNTDDVKDIVKMYESFIDGYDYVIASRYIKGGSYSGGSKLKRALSLSASKILEKRLGVIGSDPTNGFKGFSRKFYDQVHLSDSKGFTYGLQFLYFAIHLNSRIKVIPTAWQERSLGSSKFKVLYWMPSYLFWFLRVFFILHRR